MRRPRRTSSHLHHCNRGVAVRPRRDEQRVVDGLESVQIEEQQGDLPTLARGERRYLIEVVTTGTWRFAAAPSGKPRRQWQLRARASSGRESAARVSLDALVTWPANGDPSQLAS
jgi:hypothetical protein